MPPVGALLANEMMNQYAHPGQEVIGAMTWRGRRTGCAGLAGPLEPPSRHGIPSPTSPQQLIHFHFSIHDV